MANHLANLITSPKIIAWAVLFTIKKEPDKSRFPMSS